MPGDPVRRAKTAFYRSLVRRGELHPPPITTAGLVEHAGGPYVILRHGAGILAVYKITGNGTLQRLSRWPQGMEDAGVMPSVPDTAGRAP